MGRAGEEEYVEEGTHDYIDGIDCIAQVGRRAG